VGNNQAQLSCAKCEELTCPWSGNTFGDHTGNFAFLWNLDWLRVVFEVTAIGRLWVVFDERETLEPSLSAKPQGRLKPKKNQA
ncbi:MAG: hypothetical protein RLZZ539_656, partial [Pseudomonadota bacterium]